MPQDMLLTTPQAAKALGVSASWLAKSRMTGRGPKWVRMGARMVRYRASDLNAYAAERVRRSTSEDTVKSQRWLRTPALA